jgi:hypothetical protein
VSSWYPALEVRERWRDFEFRRGNVWHSLIDEGFLEAAVQGQGRDHEPNARIEECLSIS